MCNILVFIKEDNNHPDPELDWKKYKAGDVIDIQDDDNFFWGNDVQGENALGLWKPVSVIGASREEMLYTMKSDELPLVAIYPLNPDEVKHRIRIYSVDVPKLKDVMTKEEFQACVSEKPELINPQIIG